MKYHYFAFWVDKKGSFDIAIKKMYSKETKLLDIERYLDYLSYNGNLLTGYMGHEKCLLNKNHEFFGKAVFTDGVWIWDADMEHYVKEHNIQIPEAFIEHIKANNFTVAQLTNEQMGKIREENWVIVKYGIFLYPYMGDIEKHGDEGDSLIDPSKIDEEKYKEFWE